MNMTLMKVSLFPQSRRGVSLTRHALEDKDDHEHDDYCAGVEIIIMMIVMQKWKL